jgi:DNA-binding transcriptional LysR family regulator
LEAFDLLKSGRLELMFHNETPRRDLHRTHYASEQLFAVLPPGSSFEGSEASIEDLAPLGMIASHTSPLSNLRLASGEVASQRISYHLPAVCDDRRMVAGLVMRDVGVTIFPESYAREMEKQGAVIRPMAWPRREAWIYHREGHLSTAAQRFLELVDNQSE